MKKTIAFGIIMLMMPIVLAEIVEPTPSDYQVPTNGVGYFIKITLPEYFTSAKSFIDGDERVNWKLDQLQRRQYEYSVLLQKLNDTNSAEWRERYTAMLKIIEKRQEQNLKKLEKYTSLLKREKRNKVSDILAKREQSLNELKEKFAGNEAASTAISKALEQQNKIKDRFKAVAVAAQTGSLSDMTLYEIE